MQSSESQKTRILEKGVALIWALSRVFLDLFGLDVAVLSLEFLGRSFDFWQN
jgi:hypothetical protein